MQQIPFRTWSNWCSPRVAAYTYYYLEREPASWNSFESAITNQRISLEQCCHATADSMMRATRSCHPGSVVRPRPLQRTDASMIKALLANDLRRSQMPP